MRRAFARKGQEVMTEYQIKLAKLYAELIGIEVFDHKGSLLYPNDQGYMFVNDTTCEWFNPFKGQLQLDARDNFEVQVIYYDKSNIEVEIFNQNHSVSSNVWAKSIRDIPTAVIECILKSKGKL